MTQRATSAAQGCIFCAVVARQAVASVVYEVWCGRSVGQRIAAGTPSLVL
ncbi:hypothetical protein AB0H83_46080 [Dactylosporangium sp. NPDC050688]